MHAPGNCRNRQSGFTLLEVVVTMVLLGIVFVIGSKMLGRAYETYDLEKRTTNVDWQGRVALERMVRELRGIRSSADLTLPGSSAAPIFFSDAFGSPVCFCYENVTKTVRRGTSVAPNCGTGGVAPTASCGTGSTQPLAANVAASGLNFYFYDSAGAVAAASASVQVIALSLAVSEGNVSETYRERTTSRIALMIATRSQGGYLLVVAAVIILVAATMAAVMLTLNAGSSGGGSAHVLSTQALFLAESGLSEEQRRLARNVDWYRTATDPFDIATVNAGEGTYSILANIPATEVRTRLVIGATTLNVFGGGAANRWPTQGRLLIDDFSGDPEFVNYSATTATTFTLTARAQTVGTVDTIEAAHARGDSVFPVTTLNVALVANCATVPNPFTIANHTKFLDYGTITIFHDLSGTIVSEQLSYAGHTVSGGTRTLLGVTRCVNGTAAIAASIGDPVAPMVTSVGTVDFEALAYSTGTVGAAQRREYKVVQR